MARVLRNASLLLAAATTATATITCTELDPSGTPPSARVFSKGVMHVDTNNTRLLIYGGATQGGEPQELALADLWAYDLAGNTWADITPTSGAKPSARNRHVAAVDTSNGRLLIHGGNRWESVCVSDLWAYDLAGNTWADITPTSGAKPSARSGHVAAVDTSNGRLLIHGGTAGEDEADFRRLSAHASGRGLQDNPYLADLWAYDLAGNTWADITPTSGAKPSARSGHVAAVDTSNGRLLIHGGAGPTAFADLWAYDLAGNTWADITPTSGAKPSARYGHVAAVDTSNGRLLIHGGASQSTALADLWAYDLAGNTWADITPTSSAHRREGHAAALAGNKFIIFGGRQSSSTSPMNDIWEFTWVTTTSWSTTTTTTATATTVTTVTSDTNATSTTVTATETVTAMLDQIGAAPAICRPSAPALFYALFCVASLAIM